MMEELAKALQEVKEICRTHRCRECTFNTDGGCAFQASAPEYWDIDITLEGVRIRRI